MHRDSLIFDLAFALRKRLTDRRFRPASMEEARAVAAEQVAHLELCGWRWTPREPAPRHSWPPTKLPEQPPE